MKFDPASRFFELNQKEWYYRVGKNAFLHNDLDRLVFAQKDRSKKICSFEVTTPEGVYSADGWDLDGNYIGKTKCFVYTDSFPVNNLKTTLSRIETILLK